MPLSAQAATKTVVLIQPSALTGLNGSVTGMNLATNTEVMYPTGFGFYYANSAKKLVPNTTFGTWKSKKTDADFRVTYTVKPNQIWNDGTPIDLSKSTAESRGLVSISGGAKSGICSPKRFGEYNRYTCPDPTLPHLPER